MKATEPGHKYKLDKFDGGTTTLQFIHKEVNEDGELVTVNNGTTNEEVIDALIDRFTFLEGKFPCEENLLVLDKLRAARFYIDRRREERRKRGVLGKHQA